MIPLALIAMLLSPGFVAAADIRLEAANQSYKQGRYAAAAAAYQEMLQADPDNPHLRYDLANAYFKENSAGDLGRAIAQYWRAYRALPRDADIRHNFDFALKRAGESLVPSGTPQALHRAFHYLSEGELLGLQWIGYWLCLLLGSAYLLRPAVRDRLRPWMVGALAAWAFSAAWWGLRHAGEIADPGVIVEGNAEVRSGPGSNFPVSFNAPEGRRVEILSRDGDWLEIGVLKEGLKGWAPAKAVERL